MTVSKLSRRAILRTLGAAAAPLPLTSLAGCGRGSSGSPAIPEALTQGWATGGTAVMKGGYGDPFAAGHGATCTLTCTATVGPCHAQSVARKDISEGHAGLPTRLSFLLLDTSCQPVASAEVDLWHAAPEGVYSGSDAIEMCTLNDAHALAARWFRGKQTSGPDGRVDFDTCFPGWYHGRTVHIHFTVRVNGTELVTSQLFFDDLLVDAIIASQPGYKERGRRDTTSQNDSVISASEVADYTFAATRQADGALLASKVIILRSADGASCATKGGLGPGGPPPGGHGGPPPGWHGGPPPGGSGGPPPGGPPPGWHPPPGGSGPRPGAPPPAGSSAWHPMPGAAPAASAPPTSNSVPAPAPFGTAPVGKGEWR